MRRSVWRLFWNQMVTDLISLEACEYVSRTDKGGRKDVHGALGGDAFALLARRMRRLVVERLEHGELRVREASARALCNVRVRGGRVLCARAAEALPAVRARRATRAHCRGSARERGRDAVHGEGEEGGGVSRGWVGCIRGRG